jgi:hypothetical protein
MGEVVPQALNAKTAANALAAIAPLAIPLGYITVW